jgi:hypothetical protein
MESNQPGQPVVRYRYPAPVKRLENDPCPDALTPKRTKPTVLLVHLSDLFYGSGTAVIYRRLIELLGDHAAVHHYVCSWRSASLDVLAPVFFTVQNEYGTVEPVNTFQNYAAHSQFP